MVDGELTVKVTLQINDKQSPPCVVVRNEASVARRYASM